MPQVVFAAGTVIVNLVTGICALLMVRQAYHVFTTAIGGHVLALPLV